MMAGVAETVEVEAEETVEAVVEETVEVVDRPMVVVEVLLHPNLAEAPILQAGISIEMIGESVHLVHAEHLKHKTGRRIEERLHCVSVILEDDRGGLIAVEVCERGTGLLKRKLGQTLRITGERFICQRDLSQLALLLKLSTRNRLQLLSIS